MTNLFFWLLHLLLEVVSIVIIYKKVNKIKLDFNFVLLCLFIIVTIPLLSFYLSVLFSLPSYVLYYFVLFIEPFVFYFYFYKLEQNFKYSALFLSFFIYLILQTTETFFSVIVSSLTGDKFILNYWGLFYTGVIILSCVFTCKVLDYFKFHFRQIKEIVFKKQVVKIIVYYFIIHILLNFSHWFSNITHLNSFSSMIATICFLMFMSSLSYLKIIREKYEKEEQIKQKEKEQLQLQQYTDEIVTLYNQIRGFRHDYSGMLTSLRFGIQTGNMKEVERIYQDVLKDVNVELSSEKYTTFDLQNVGDSALKSVMTEALFKARKHHIDLRFEIKDPIEKLPIKLLDVVRIASILLDNALEASIESYEKFVHVSIVQLDRELLFIVKNSRLQRELDVEEIYQIEFSTKGKSRGLGLSNIKEILDSYDFITLDTEIGRNDFTQILTIRRKSGV
ncbi:MAG: GHKL domain-containing protein [Streptococcus sp.]|nr:GHKL domain-containing protein [Streptococcus sp.]